MAKFIIEDSFWELFPKAEIGVVVLKGIDNTTDGVEKNLDEIARMLKEANITAKKHITQPTLSQCPVVSVWREAFMKFKKKKDNRSSIEALLKRVEKGKEVGAINPLVDIYNTVSLTYGLPAGGEDIDTFEGNLRLTVTVGGDEFMAIGDKENNPTLPGEVCYLDDAGAVCRCWNWRDGVRTMLRESTKNVFISFDSVDPARHDDLMAAMNQIEENVVSLLGGKVTAKGILTIDNQQIEL